VIRALRTRLPLALGFGATLWVLLWVPVLNFFLMPVAVVAGTLLFRGLLSSGALPESQ
jgi:CysZ protein